MEPEGLKLVLVNQEARKQFEHFVRQSGKSLSTFSDTPQRLIYTSWEVDFGWRCWLAALRGKE